MFQAEDGIRGVERSRGLGGVYKDSAQGVGLFSIMCDTIVRGGGSGREVVLDDFHS